MRKFRAIVQSTKEPQDHEVVWKKDGELLYWNNGWVPFHEVSVYTIEYETEEDVDIHNIGQALDKLLYTSPKITRFVLAQAGTYEKGRTIEVQNFNWSYNKNNMEKQAINGMEIPVSERSLVLNEQITTNTTFTLAATDGKNNVSANASINFVNYMYYGTIKNGETITRLSKNPSSATVTINVGANEYAWIFIPDSAHYTKIWFNNVDSTSDFVLEDVNFNTDTDVTVPGILYVSKNHSLNSITLKFT